MSSKIVSAKRLNKFFGDIGLCITENSNLRLYLTGMFYNLFLPGGIGGDGYKIYLLLKTGISTLKKVSLAVLFDRINGLLAIWIFIWTGIILMPVAGNTRIIAIPTLVLPIIVYYIIIICLLPFFRKNISQTILFSITVQLLQILTALFISFSIGIREDLIEVFVIFLISSAIAVLPITLGGIGVRELVFLYGSRFLGIDESSAVAISILFFILSALVSLCGIYYAIIPPKVELKTII